MPLSTALDTVGYLIRDPYLWDTANSVIYGSNYRSIKQANYPKKIYTVGFPSTTSTAASSVMLNKFLTQLTEFIGGATVTPFVVANEWQATKPVEAGSSTLTQLMNTTYAVFITKEQTALVRDPFYADYAGT